MKFYFMGKYRRFFLNYARKSLVVVVKKGSCLCLFKLFPVGVIHVDGGNQCGEAPHGDGQLVGVEEVVEETVDEIAEEGEGGTQD